MASPVARDIIEAVRGRRIDWDIFGPDVKWFGAKGDGNTNDTTAFLNATNEKNALIIPPGTYMLDVGQLAFAKPIYLRGASRGTVTLKATGGSGDLLKWSGNSTGGGISDIKIDMAGVTGGNAVSNIGQSRWVARDLILVSGYNGIYIEDQNVSSLCRIYMLSFTGAYGIKVYGTGVAASQVCDMDNIAIGFGTNGATSPTGIIIDGDATTIDIRHIGVAKGFRGISVVNTPNFPLGPLFVTAYDFQSDFAYDRSIYIDGGTGSTRTHHFTDCYTHASQSSNGIEVTSTGSFCTFTNSLVTGHNQRGILDNGRYTKIVGCQISNNSQVGVASFPGVEFGATSIGSNMSDCLSGQWVGVASENQSYGVLVTAGATNYTISSNNLTNNVTGPYLDNAGHSGSNIFGNALPSSSKHIINAPIQAQVGQNLTLLGDGTNSVLMGNATNGTGFAAQAADATTVNFLKAFGHSTGASPALASTGTDTDIGLNLLPKGAGVVQVGNASSFAANNAQTVTIANVGPGAAGVNITKWLQIKDNGGTVRYIPCFS